MTKNQIEELMNMINAAYPNYTRHLSDTERKAQLVLWHAMLLHDDANIVREIVMKHISTSQYLPTVAEVRKEIRRATMPDEENVFENLIECAKMSVKTESVLKEKGEGGQADTYATKSLSLEAFAELSDELKAFVKTPAGLQALYRKWVMSPDDARRDFDAKIEQIRKEIDFQKVKTGQVNIHTLQIGGSVWQE